mgnify:FL=1
MNLNELPKDWQQEVKELRYENAMYRRERNKLRDELAALNSARPEGLRSPSQTLAVLGGDE